MTAKKDQNVEDGIGQSSNPGTDALTGAPANADGTTTQGGTFQEAAENATTTTGEAYEKGYFGYAPSKDGPNAVDLSVAGVVKAAQDAKVQNNLEA